MAEAAAVAAIVAASGVQRWLKRQCLWRLWRQFVADLLICWLAAAVLAVAVAKRFERAATGGSRLQHTAASCSSLQHVVTGCSIQ